MCKTEYCIEYEIIFNFVIKKYKNRKKVYQIGKDTLFRGESVIMLLSFYLIQRRHPKQ